MADEMKTDEPEVDAVSAEMGSDADSKGEAKPHPTGEEAEPAQAEEGGNGIAGGEEVLVDEVRRVPYCRTGWL